MQKEILRERKVPRNESLDKEKSQRNDSKRTYNVTYYPVFRHLKSQLKELHGILACDEDHKEVFPEVTIIGFKSNENLKSHLVRAALPDINEVGRCEPYGGKRPPCQLCSNMKNTSTFKSKHSNEVYQIKKNFNCNYKMVVYMIECRVCRKQYNGSPVTKFLARANNYKSIHPNFRNKQLPNQARNQKRFHEDYLQNDHNGICDWEITIIYHAEKEKSLRQKELYWYHKLIIAPFGLNERDGYAAY